MWLIDTENFSLHEVQEAGQDHPYAILSHTWDEVESNPLHREVTFKDMHSIKTARSKTGWIKVEQTCRLARQADLKWAWIDTCCIDKSSSAELSEAINSMFRWYQQATVCFAYLSDLPSSPSRSERVSLQMTNDLLPRCVWFTRGWTLQELIAPQHLEFYDATWTIRGTKRTLKYLISTILGINEGVLDGTIALSDIPVAQRMCWASRRKTKRLEDLAYSLLGIFDVNMPLIYGEGMKAFLRLQDMIAQQIPDLTLFAWCNHGSAGNDKQTQQHYRGIFASSPQDFKDCVEIRLIKDPANIEAHLIINANHRLQFQTNLRMDRILGDYVMSLSCCKGGTERENGLVKSLGVRLIKTATGYIRHRCDQLVPSNWTYLSLDDVFADERIPLLKEVSAAASERLETRFKNAFKFHMNDVDAISLGYTSGLRRDLSNQKAYENISHLWDRVTDSFMTESHVHFVGLMGLLPKKSKGHTDWADSLRILCGFYNPQQQTRAIDTDRPLDLVPWVCIISRRSEWTEPMDGDTAESLFASFQHLSAWSSSAGYITNALSTQVSSRIAEGAKLCTKVLLYLSGMGSGFHKRYVLSVDVRTIGTSHSVLHHVFVSIKRDQRP